MKILLIRRFFFLPVLFAALAGCSDPSGGGGGGYTETDGVPYDWAITREDGSGALEGENVIWRDQEPYRLTLKVDEKAWQDVSWEFGVNTVKTGYSLTLDARILKEADYILVFTGLRQGVPHSINIPFSVKGARAAEIGWLETEKNTSFTGFDLGAWTGYNQPVETWRLLAGETPSVYFAVRKKAAQTIMVEGPDSGRVTKAAAGETVDGSTASAELDVFTVDTGDAETLFGGGEIGFTLKVWEGGKTEAKQVDVSLVVSPRLTGAAIFAVKDGRAARITSDNVSLYSNELYASHTQNGFPGGWGINIADVYNLAGALKWLDSYAKSGTSAADLAEYLVRVEKNEVMNKTALTGFRQNSGGVLVQNIKVRLRGYGSERRITHNPTEVPNSVYSKDSGDMLIPDGFINVGLAISGNSTKYSSITLQLEENITIDASGGKDSNFPHEYMSSIVEVTGACTFIMKEGSKLTNGRGVYAVTVGGHYSYENSNYTVYGGRFEMRGGEISSFTGNIYVIYLSVNHATLTIGTFGYAAGVFKDNDSSLVHRPYYDYDLYSAAKYRLDGE
jgi:hypothetical protein